MPSDPRKSAVRTAPPQTPGERHPRPRAKVSQPVDQHHHSVMFLLAERGQPLDDLVEQLDFSHPAIIAYLRSSYKCDHGKIASAQNHRRGSGNGPRDIGVSVPRDVLQHLLDAPLLHLRIDLPRHGDILLDSQGCGITPGALHASLPQVRRGPPRDPQRHPTRTP